MPERSVISQAVQIGAETTAGTAVSASKLLNSMSFEPGVEFEATEFRPMGQKYRSMVVPAKEWMTWTIGGPAAYGEIVYPLSSILTTTTASASDTSARIWTFTPAARTEDTVKTYTIEQGSSVRAHKSTYGIFTDYNLEFTRNGVEQTGTVMSQRLQDGITMSSSPTAVEEKPIIPTHVDLYIDSTSAGLGVTQMTRAFRVAVNIGGRFGPVWPLLSSATSFSSHVETEPTVEVELRLESDATGMGFLTQARAGDTRFVRVKCTSTELAGAATLTYELRVDMAMKIKAVSSPVEDEDGVAVVNYTGAIVYDATWTKALEARVINKVTAL